MGFAGWLILNKWLSVAGGIKVRRYVVAEERAGRIVLVSGKSSKCVVMTTYIDDCHLETAKPFRTLVWKVTRTQCAAQDPREMQIFLGVVREAWTSASSCRCQCLTETDYTAKILEDAVKLAFDPMRVCLPSNLIPTARSTWLSGHRGIVVTLMARVTVLVFVQGTSSISRVLSVIQLSVLNMREQLPTFSSTCGLSSCILPQVFAHPAGRAPLSHSVVRRGSPVSLPVVCVVAVGVHLCRPRSLQILVVCFGALWYQFAPTLHPYDGLSERTTTSPTRRGRDSGCKERSLCGPH